MKTKAFILSAFVLLSSVAFGQTEKGKWTVSGNTSLQILNTGESGYDNKTNITLNTSAGYFVINNLAIGVSFAAVSQEGYSAISIIHTEPNGWQSIKQEIHHVSISVLPTATYYFPTASKIKPYIQAGIGYGTTKISFNFTDGLALGGGGGIAYFINKNVSLDFGLQYLRNDYDGSIYSTFGGVVGFSLFF